MPTEPHDRDWQLPPREECDEVGISTPLDELWILSWRRVTWNGRLVEYAIVLLTRGSTGDQRTEVLSIDTQHHGCVHRHDGPDHTRPFTHLRDIKSEADVQQSFDSSYDTVYNEYLRRTGQDPLR